MTTTMMSSPKPELELLRGASETFTDSHSTTPGSIRPLKVPSCRPTPLIGTWADESWPLNSRQASEIITEQVLTKQCSSTLFEDDFGNILIVSSSSNNGIDAEDDSSSCPDDQETVNESMMMEAMSHAQVSEETHSSFGQSIDSPCHVAQSFRFDPYSISNAEIVLARCTCDACFTTLQHKKQREQLLKQLAAPVHQDESVSNQVSPAVDQVSAAAAVRPSAHAFLAAPPQIVQDTFAAEEECDWDLPTYQPSSHPARNAFTQHQQHHMPQQAAQHYQPQQAAAAAPQFHQFPTAPATATASGFMTHTQLSSPPFMEMVTPTVSPGNLNATPGSNVSGLSLPPPTQRRMLAVGEKPVAQPRELSAFMPPPPPPRIATMVFEEEKSIKNPSGIYYHLVMRWYGKVQEVQSYFARDQDFCPAPNKDLYSFEQWADEVSGWWYTHFEHMQKNRSRFARRN